MVQPTISSQGSNSSIQVSWNKPSGNVEYYAVFLELQLSPQQSQNITMGTTVKFDGLSAGRIYSARVVTHSGPRSSASTYVSNATCESQTFFVFTKIFNHQRSAYFTEPSVTAAMRHRITVVVHSVMMPSRSDTLCHSCYPEGVRLRCST